MSKITPRVCVVCREKFKDAPLFCSIYGCVDVKGLYRYCMLCEDQPYCATQVLNPTNGNYTSGYCLNCSSRALEELHRRSEGRSARI